jgi:hypothetical protein
MALATRKFTHAGTSMLRKRTRCCSSTFSHRATPSLKRNGKGTGKKGALPAVQQNRHPDETRLAAGRRAKQIITYKGFALLRWIAKMKTIKVVGRKWRAPDKR